MWKRCDDKAALGTLRFCQTAFELPFRELYGGSAFTVAIAQTCQMTEFPERDRESFALGALHSEGGVAFDSVGPILPCRVAFCDSRSSLYEDKSEAIIGRADVEYWTGEPPHYRLSVSVRDPQSELFDMVETAVGHAAISKRQFISLTFVTPRSKKRHPKSGKDSLLWDALARRVYNGEEQLASIPVQSVWLQDRTTAATPVWALAWEDVDALEGAAFHDRMVAKVRSARNEQSHSKDE